MQRHRAFTLIELLIVVAIIAILAAIAVPNFLEAQVRSKVSRVKADMRTYATAIEAYAVDHNDYPPVVAPWLPSGGGPSIAHPLESVLTLLSTPQAYMSNGLIPEPFNAKRGWLLYRGWDVIDAGGPPPDAAQREALYLYCNLPNDEIISAGKILIQLYLAGVGITLTLEEIEELFSKRWVMGSPGPDTFYRFDQLRAQDPGADDIALIFGQVTSLMLPQLNVIYDPTNGTISAGDIARTGGGTQMERR